jgi:hypothetical protein
MQGVFRRQWPGPWQAAQHRRCVLLATPFGAYGLVVIVPVIGYGAWHGYLETIDASDFPRHEVGITSIPRNDPSP